MTQRLLPGDVALAVPRPLGDDPSLLGRYRRLRARESDGFLFSRSVSDRAGAIVAAFAEPLKVHPSVLTLGNLVLGLAGSGLVLLADRAPAISVAGLFGLLLWQLAYILDCADGQLARATARTTPSGARLDIFVDATVQTSVLVAVAGVIEHWSRPPFALVVIFAGTWFVNFLAYLLDSGDNQAVPGLLPSRSAVVSLIKLTRDYGFVVLVFGAWLTFAPTTLLVPVLVVTAVNTLLLAAYITQDAWISIRSPATDQDVHPGRTP